ncbi:hypothetical protein VTK56DRAFT_3842 [Thermocarpiscus australiensis]
MEPGRPIEGVSLDWVVGCFISLSSRLLSFPLSDGLGWVLLLGFSASQPTGSLMTLLTTTRTILMMTDEGAPTIPYIHTWTAADTDRPGHATGTDGVYVDVSCYESLSIDIDDLGLVHFSGLAGSDWMTGTGDRGQNGKRDFVMGRLVVVSKHWRQ